MVPKNIKPKLTVLKEAAHNLSPHNAVIPIKNYVNRMRTSFCDILKIQKQKRTKN